MQIKTKIVSCYTADSKPVKQEVNGTVILPPLIFPARTLKLKMIRCVIPLRATHVGQIKNALVLKK